MILLVKILVWCVSGLGVAVFLYFALFPYIKKKVTFWFWSRKIRKMAKKYPGEEGDKLNVFNMLMSGFELTKARALEMNIYNFVPIRLKLQKKGYHMSKKRVEDNMVAYYMTEEDKKHNNTVKF